MISKLVYLLNKSNSLVYTNHTVKLSFPDRFIKLGFNERGRNQILREYENFSKLENRSFKNWVPKKSISKFFGICCLELEILKPINGNFCELRPLYEKFNSNSRRGTFEEILPALNEVIDNSEIQNFLLSLKNLEIMIGDVHGDFHVMNVMRSDSGKYKMIDLDLFRENWIREFDLINSLVSHFIFEEGLKWKEAFMVAHKTQTLLREIDPSWCERPEQERSKIFYLYYVCRKIDEEESFDREEHNYLHRMLEIK